MTSRVAIVCGAFQPMLDGVADYAVRLINQLSALGVSAAVISSDEGPDTAGVDLHRVTRLCDLQGIRAVARAVERLDPDIIHIQFAPSAYRFSAAIGLLPLFVGDQRPLVTTLHEYGWWSWRPRMIPETLLRPLWWAAERLSVWDRESLLLAVRSSALIVTNRQHFAVMSRRFERSPAVIIPVGPNVPPVPVDPERARRGLRQRLGTPPDARILAFFGFVHPVKGLPYLFEALARLRSRHPDLHLVVVGGFHSLALPRADARRYERDLKGLLAKLDLTQAVTFTGYVPSDQASRVLQGADLAVLPFNAGTTTKSSALLAVLVHGLPTVATTPDLADPGLVHERTVLFVPPRDSPAVEAAIERLLTDPDLSLRLGDGGRRLAERHSWPTIAKQHKRLYETVLRRWPDNASAGRAPSRKGGTGTGPARSAARTEP